MHYPSLIFRMTLYCFFIMAAYLLTTQQRPKPPITQHPTPTTASSPPRLAHDPPASSAPAALLPSRSASFPTLTAATDQQCRGMFTTEKGHQNTLMISGKLESRLLFPLFCFVFRIIIATFFLYVLFPSHFRLPPSVSLSVRFCTPFSFWILFSLFSYCIIYIRIILPNFPPVSHFCHLLTAPSLPQLPFFTDSCFLAPISLPLPLPQMTTTGS